MIDNASKHGKLGAMGAQRSSTAGSQTAAMDGVTASYEIKPSHYFKGARADFVALLPGNATARILEIGCGYGGTGALALANGKCGAYIGIEIADTAAAEASKYLTHVLVGNVETMDLPFEPASFDAVVISEVLEHLTDPWTVLTKIAPLLRDNALIMASSPNISHYKVIRSLLRGEWTLTELGVMDRTHLRWFTPSSYKAMFEQCGFTITQVQPVSPETAKIRWANRLTGNRFRHLFMRQIMVVGHKRAN